MPHLLRLPSLDSIETDPEATRDCRQTGPTIRGLGCGSKIRDEHEAASKLGNHPAGPSARACRGGRRFLRRCDHFMAAHFHRPMDAPTRGICGVHKGCSRAHHPDLHLHDPGQFHSCPVRHPRRRMASWERRRGRHCGRPGRSGREFRYTRIKWRFLRAVEPNRQSWRPSNRYSDHALRSGCRHCLCPGSMARLHPTLPITTVTTLRDNPDHCSRSRDRTWMMRARRRCSRGGDFARWRRACRIPSRSGNAKALPRKTGQVTQLMACPRPSASDRVAAQRGLPHERRG